MKIVIQEVAKAFGVKEAQLMGNQRWYPLALARHVAMVLCLESHPFYPVWIQHTTDVG